MLAFAVLALLAVVAGGRAHIDLCGAVCLFVIGGLVGLAVQAIYNKGQRDANPPPSARENPTSDPAEPGAGSR